MHAAYDESGRNVCKQIHQPGRKQSECAITKTTLDTTENHRDNTCLVVFYNQAISVRVLLFTCNWPFHNGFLRYSFKVKSHNCILKVSFRFFKVRKPVRSGIRLASQRAILQYFASNRICKLFHCRESWQSAILFLSVLAKYPFHSTL